MQTLIPAAMPAPVDTSGKQQRGPLVSGSGEFAGTGEVDTSGKQQRGPLEAPKQSLALIDAVNALPESTLSKLVDAYMSNPGLLPDDDPMADLRRLVGWALSYPGATEAARIVFPEPPLVGKRERSEGFHRWAAACLFAINPSLSKLNWYRIYEGIMSARYGGTRVRINKRPALQKRLDAKRMTARQLMEKHSISRSRAYQLLAEVRNNRL